MSCAADAEEDERGCKSSSKGAGQGDCDKGIIDKVYE
jgi:hypothetical protein